MSKLGFKVRAAKVRSRSFEAPLGVRQVFLTGHHQKVDKCCCNKNIWWKVFISKKVEVKRQRLDHSRLLHCADVLMIMMALYLYHIINQGVKVQSPLGNRVQLVLPSWQRTGSRWRQQQQHSKVQEGTTKTSHIVPQELPVKVVYFLLLFEFKLLCRAVVKHHPHAAFDTA